MGARGREFKSHRPDQKKLRRPKFRKLAENSFKGTARQQRVPRSFFETQHIPVPPKEEQHRIVNHLDKLQSQVGELRKYQAETQKELLGKV